MCGQPDSVKPVLLLTAALRDPRAAGNGNSGNSEKLTSQKGVEERRTGSHSFPSLWDMVPSWEISMQISTLTYGGLIDKH